jgi:hypothetical protein
MNRWRIRRGILVRLVPPGGQLDPRYFLDIFPSTAEFLGDLDGGYLCCFSGKKLFVAPDWAFVFLGPTPAGTLLVDEPDRQVVFLDRSMREALVQVSRRKHKVACCESVWAWGEAS